MRCSADQHHSSRASTRGAARLRQRSLAIRPATPCNAGAAHKLLLMSACGPTSCHRQCIHCHAAGRRNTTTGPGDGNALVLSPPITPPGPARSPHLMDLPGFSQSATDGRNQVRYQRQMPPAPRPNSPTVTVNTSWLTIPVNRQPAPTTISPIARRRSVPFSVGRRS
jgi:hypothetical protein